MTDPDPVRVVPRELLEELAATGAPAAPPPPATPARTESGEYRSRLLVDRWLAARGVGFRVKAEPDARGRTVYVLAACPFDPAHADPDACVMQAPDGRLSAQCFHNSCAGRGWQQFKDRIGRPEPHHYDPPLCGPRARRPRPRHRPAPGPAASAPAVPSGTASTPDPAAPTGAPGETPATGGVPPGDGPPEPAAPPQPSGRRVIVVEPETTPVSATMRAVTDTLLGAGDCFRRADQLVRVTGSEVVPVLSAAELAGLLNHHAEVQFVSGESAAFRPLPTSYASTWLNHPGEGHRLPRIALFTHNPVYTPDWRLAAPGYDADSGIYNAGPAVEPCDTTEHLDRLLADFCFRTPGDRTNYVGVLLTALLVPRFIGSKPAVLFNGNQPGLGKSVLAQIVAILRDGRPTETGTYNPNDEEFEKRLGAIVRRGATTIIIDNAKGTGRNPRIDSACLERSITDPVLSFRLLGYSREIRAENSHIFCLTANTPDVSRDLVTRSVVVGLYHEGDPATRAFTIPDPEGYAEEHRVELLGELVGMVERWRAAGSPAAAVCSRFNKKGWGPTVGGILQVAGYPDFLANAAAAAAELDDTRREFAALVAAMADQPQGTWTCAELAGLADANRLFPAKGPEESPRGRATRIGMLAGRYVGERFPVTEARTAVFERTTDRKGNVYRVALEDTGA
ncbi:Putative DNA-directed DNA polymerase OS=Corynebacterium genitalium ATCC 33030 GN=HMPREF0291_11989 PE=3 SV=1 [Gemmataceae bacterium]|nr:Putative DNA-directed DNA polymerase OS=Corynebacterium genitalium ATCC 33030 GN=HMPREF0291_11989 PE=3 SV=1 [Gemmataceae bacterium]VTU02483.1 Putative DNA-directed DNA polymerase OS=Corynebacterium genitalium ATCC 33030 GN=HMPREF0291_11989 PE=3 SV=1 [Gemmataceae bacterium]